MAQVAALFLVFLMTFLQLNAAQAIDCQYEFSAHPKTDLRCDPRNLKLQLQCTVTGHLDSNSKIHWYQAPRGAASSSKIRLDGSQDYQIITNTLDITGDTSLSQRAISSTLTTPPIAEAHEDQCIWCQVESEDQEYGICFKNSAHYSTLPACKEEDLVIVNTTAVCGSTLSGATSEAQVAVPVALAQVGSGSMPPLETTLSPDSSTDAMSPLAPDTDPMLPSTMPEVLVSSETLPETTSTILTPLDADPEPPTETNSAIPTTITPPEPPITEGPDSPVTQGPSLDQSDAPPSMENATLDANSSGITTEGISQSMSSLEAGLVAAIAVCVVFIFAIIVLIYCAVCLSRRRCSWGSKRSPEGPVPDTISGVDTLSRTNSTLPRRAAQAAAQYRTADTRGAPPGYSADYNVERTRAESDIRAMEAGRAFAVQKNHVDANFRVPVGPDRAYSVERSPADNAREDGPRRVLGTNSLQDVRHLPLPPLPPEHSAVGTTGPIPKPNAVLSASLGNVRLPTSSENRVYENLRRSEPIPPPVPARSSSIEHFYHTLECKRESALFEATHDSDHSSVSSPVEDMSRQVKELFDDPRYAILLVGSRENLAEEEGDSDDEKSEREVKEEMKQTTAESLEGGSGEESDIESGTECEGNLRVFGSRKEAWRSTSSMDSSTGSSLIDSTIKTSQRTSLTEDNRRSLRLSHVVGTQIYST